MLFKYWYNIEVSLYYYTFRSIFCLNNPRLNPFPEATNTKQLGESFLLNETMGSFDGARTHDWQVSTDRESDALTSVPAAHTYNLLYHTLFILNTCDGFLLFHAHIYE